MNNNMAFRDEEIEDESLVRHFVLEAEIDGSKTTT